MDAAHPEPQPDYVKWLFIVVLILGAVAVALLLIGISWPLPRACTASEQPNPAYEDASRYQAVVFQLGALAAGGAALTSLIGILVGIGRRGWFALVGVLAIPLCLYLALAAALSGFPCHGMY